MLFETCRELNTSIRLVAEAGVDMSNLAEGLVSLLMGEGSDSISLIVFGADSFVEVFSSVIVVI